MSDRPTSGAARSLSVVVLAAGEGTRMRSERPKPLHRLCGRPMVLHVLDAAAELNLERAVVVIGHGATRVAKAVGEQPPPGVHIDFVEQRVQRGTGDAVSVALTAFPDDDLDGGDVLVLPGDTPLLRSPTLAALVRTHRHADAAATVLTAKLADPTGYGRVVRSKDGRVARIVEQADATDAELAVEEINTSIYVFRRSVMAPALRRLSPDNAQGEYYLTDIVAVLHSAGYPVTSLTVDDPMEAAGVNDRAQLAVAEAELRDRINERWMRRGVTMLDPERTYLDTTVELAPDVTLYPGTLLQGATTVERGAEVGPNSHLADCRVGARAVVTATVGRAAEIGADAYVGPWAYLPPGSHLAVGSVTGPCFTGATAEHEG
ncbi:MAG: bifunctional UDP-N-acetylglucosamine diphosphorylase/glucosamine-1-phosphate N-acetyltransferase GlmU [Acidimicrobiales bacterium]